MSASTPKRRRLRRTSKATATPPPKPWPIENPYPTKHVLSAMIFAGDPMAVAHFLAVLDHHNGHRQSTADALGVHVDLIYRWIRSDAVRGLVDPGVKRPGNKATRTHNSRTLTIDEWTRELGITRAEFYRREKLGKTGDALFAPKRKG